MHVLHISRSVPGNLKEVLSSCFILSDPVGLEEVDDVLWLLLLILMGGEDDGEMWLGFSSLRLGFVDDLPMSAMSMHMNSVKYTCNNNTV